MSISSFDTSPFQQSHTRVSVIDRPRLGQLLSTKTQCTLTLVTAPAGYGKTTALHQWVSSTKRPVVWVNLTASDRSADDLISRFSHSCVDYANGDAQVVDVGRGLIAGSQGGARRELRVIAAELAACLSGLASDVILVVDNVSTDASADQRELLGSIAELIAQNVRFVISSRTYLDIPVSRLRADGAVAEIRFDSLAFTTEETRALLNDGLGFGLTQDQIATLTARTEGWAAGLRLAALTLQESSDVAISVEVFNGTNRYVQSYFVDEVLSALHPSHLRDSLLRMSITTTFNAEIAATLTGHDDGGHDLERLAKENLFVIPVDETNRWYRYHHLFSDFLRFRLEREIPNETGLLHRRACEWFSEYNRPQDATHHAVALRDWELAVSLLKPLGGPAAVQFQAIVDWIRTLPEEALRGQPALSIWNAWAELQAGHIRAAEKAIDLSEQTWKAQGDLSHRGEILFLRSRVARCRAEGRLAISLGEQALAHIPAEAASMRILTLLSIARGHMIEGAPIDAEAVAQEAYKLGQDSAETPECSLGMSLAHVGVAQAKQGRLSLALGSYREAIELCERSPYGVPVHITVFMSELLIERNEIDAAAEMLTGDISRTRQENIGVLKPEIWLQLARISNAQRNPEGTLTTLEHIISWSRRTGSRIGLARAEAMRARIWLEQGAVDRVQTWLDRCGLDEDVDVSYEQADAGVILARMLMRQYLHAGKTSYSDRALRILRQLASEALNEKRNMDAVKLIVLGAVARQDRADTSKALSHLERALSIAMPERAVRPFLDEGEPILRLAHIARESGIVGVHIDSLISAFDNENGDDKRQSASHVDPQVVELSKREHEILRFIAAGLTNQEIAVRMFISVNTVKTHLKHIFAKVGATSRAQAIARSFAVGLL